ncbi:MAG: hypothetical protein KatS3mg078_2333 [Deltaproteobacteria bacterium]|nr:MAG: hypothetical protein KatS3mg078_2333 [Deltaproteobacteria bacterium]
MVDSARGAIASVLGLQVGSLALGAAVVSAFSSVIVDYNGHFNHNCCYSYGFFHCYQEREGML